jgi:MFS family permease
MALLMLGANFVWIAYDNVLLPTLVEGSTMQYRGLTTGLIGFFGTLVGVMVSLLTGIATDHSTNRWGRRTPALLVGALAGLPFIALAAVFHVPSLAVIVVSFVGMQCFTNVGNGAWWPLIVDVVPEHRRGFTAGVAGLYALLGAAAGIGLVTLLNQQGRTSTALWVLAVSLGACGLVTVAAVRRHDIPAEPATERLSTVTLFRDMFRVRRRVTVFFWVIAASFLANMALNSLQFFARFFFQTYFPGISPDYGFRLMGGISLVCTMLSAVAAGLASDRIGRRRLILASMFASGVLTLFMGFVESFSAFLVLAALRSLATGPIVGVIPALAADLAPAEEAGQYMAYNNVATGLSGAVSSLAFGLVLTTIDRRGFETLFVITAVLFVSGGAVFLLKAPERELRAHAGGAPDAPDDTPGDAPGGGEAQGEAAA